MPRMHLSTLVLAVASALTSTTAAYDDLFRFSNNITVETRSIDEIYQAALAEGGVVTIWHGGAAQILEAGFQKQFETRFPGVTLNITVDESKYQDVDLDRQLAAGNLYVDVAMLQTVQNYPRWKKEGAIINYKPAGFDQVYEAFRDPDGAFYGTETSAWSIIWNEDKLGNITAPQTFADFLKPEWKNKIVACYPNDDDAVLRTFQLILDYYGLAWWDAFLLQNPTWVRGAYQPNVLVSTPNNSYVATFTSTVGLVPTAPVNMTYPSQGAPFTSWAQYSAIFTDAPHPEAAKLLVNWALSTEFQNTTTRWPTRTDITPPTGYSQIWEQPNTDPTKFANFMGDREAVERLRMWFEGQIGTPQGPNTSDA